MLSEALTKTDASANLGESFPIKVIDGFLSEDALAHAARVIETLPPVTHGLFWLDVKTIARHGQGDPSAILPLQAYFGDFAGFLMDYLSSLWDVVKHHAIPDEAMFEFWIDKLWESDPNKIYLHRDTHSGPKQRDEPLPYPVLGAVMHIGPESGLVGGSTFFCMNEPTPAAVMDNDRRPNMTIDQTLALADDWREVERKRNRLLVFPGTLSHFVGPIERLSPAREPRTAVVANLWNFNPLRQDGISRLTAEEFDVYKRLAPGELSTLMGMLRRLDAPEALTVMSVFSRISQQLHSEQDGWYYPPAPRD